MSSYILRRKKIPANQSACMRKQRQDPFTRVAASGTELWKRSIQFSILLEGEKFRRSSLQVGYKVNFATFNRVIFNL